MGPQIINRVSILKENTNQNDLPLDSPAPKSNSLQKKQGKTTGTFCTNSYKVVGVTKAAKSNIAKFQGGFVV